MGIQERIILLGWEINASEIDTPLGFQASGIHSGIKESDLDLALIFSETPSIGAALFTENSFKAAPVQISQKHLSQNNGVVRAIIVNSGNANACTGETGLTTALRMTEIGAQLLNISREQVLVCSTGVIGVPLPVDPIVTNSNYLKQQLSPSGFGNAAQAILTTDTSRKLCSALSNLKGKQLKIFGITKGAGMIHPQMATTLAFIVTDVAITQNLLYKALNEACRLSYNSISVDGDTSTNDTLAVIANGASNSPVINDEGADYSSFLEGLIQVCQSLAHQVTRDGEGAGKFLTIKVVGASSETNATKIARKVSNSLLVKTAIAGEDANWGRILMAIGNSGVSFNNHGVSIFIGDIQVCRNGEGLPFDERKAKMILKKNEIDVTIQFNDGNASAYFWTCDLTKKYVDINAYYRT